MAASKLSLVLLIGLFSINTTAQVIRGSISGTIVDSTQSAVVGAEIRATQRETNQTFRTVSDSVGLFKLSLLPVGTYDVEFTKPGFQKSVKSSLTVNAGADVGLGAVKLEVGTVNERIEVTTAAPLIDSSEAQVSSTYTAGQIQQFAGITENQGLDNLALFVPGVVPSRDLSFASINGVGFSTNGIRARNNDQQIDGQNNNDNSTGGPSLFLSNPEFVDQYQVTTSNFGAEYGRNSGSVVNIITKSGTNDFHSSVFGTESNSALNSLNNIQKRFQALNKVPRFNDEFTGFTLGGPLVKNKVFFFGGFDDQIVSSATTYSTGQGTPTPAGLQDLASCFPNSSSVTALQQFGPYGVTKGHPIPSGTLRTITILDCSTPITVGGVQRTIPNNTHILDWIAKIDVATKRINPGYSKARDTNEFPQQAPQLAIERAILVQGHARDYLRELSDTIGGRVTGSRSYERSVDWGVKKFQEMGMTRVYVETFEMPSGWERGTSTGHIVSPVQRPLHIESLGWSPSTRQGGDRGVVFVLSDLDADYIKARASEINGHIVLLDSTQPNFGESWTSFFRKQQVCYSLLNKLGAVGVLEPDLENNNVLNADAATWDGSLAPLPIGQIGMEDARFIKRIAENTAVEIAYEFQNTIRGPIEVKNVIAELSGNERPDEWVVVGAHLDSWDFAAGILDNGSGVAMVLEAARTIRTLQQRPNRSMRFMLWGGEEQGLLGSTAWVRTHRNELDKIVAYLNTDNGCGHPKGWKVEGRNDVEKAMEPVSHLLSDLDGDGLSEETTYDTDHGPFMLEGVPALDLWVDMENYFHAHHKSGDTFEKAENLNLDACSAIVAVTAYTLAVRPEPIGKRLDQPGVRELLKRANLDLDFLKSLGWSL